MTKDKIACILHEVMDGDAGVYTASIFLASERILSAIEDENKGALVLGDGHLQMCLAHDFVGVKEKIPTLGVLEKCLGKKGQLIFRPDQKGVEKGGRV